MGWFTVIAFLLMLLAATVGCVRIAVGRRWEYLLVAGVAVALVRPVLRLVTYDVSRWLPTWMWSAGSDGKDQIVYVSAGATVLLPVIGGAVLLASYKLLRGRIIRE
jgi:hypothetical protein